MILFLLSSLAFAQYLLEAKPEECTMRTPCIRVFNATEVDLTFRGKKRDRVPAETAMWASTPYMFYQGRGVRLSDGAICRIKSSLEVPADHTYIIVFEPAELRCKTKK